jgi:hypothetical protein
VLTENNRAFKEWAIVCEALKAGKQILLLRKGGIREEEGTFRLTDTEFFLMPTYEHQHPRLLQPAYAEKLKEIQAAGCDLQTVTLDAYAVVDAVMVAPNEERVQSLSGEHIWNEQYVKERFDYNPYDPLYVILLRVYHLPQQTALPMRPEYTGCKSWVTLERALPTTGAMPALSADEFARRRQAVMKALGI